MGTKRLLLVAAACLCLGVGVTGKHGIEAASGTAPDEKMFFNANHSTNCGDCEWESGQIGLVDGPEEIISTAGTPINPNCDATTCTGHTLPPTLPSGITEVLAIKQDPDDTLLRWDFNSTTISEFCYVLIQAHESHASAAQRVYTWVTTGNWNKFGDTRATYRSGTSELLRLRNNNSGGSVENDSAVDSYPGDTWHEVTYCFDETSNNWQAWIGGDPSVDAADVIADDATSGGGAFESLAVGQELGGDSVYIGGICVWKSATIASPPSQADRALCAP